MLCSGNANEAAHSILDLVVARRQGSPRWLAVNRVVLGASLSGVRPSFGRLSGSRTVGAVKWAESCGAMWARRLLSVRAMSTTDRPAAVPAQSTTVLDHQRGAALGTAGGGGSDGAARAGYEDLAIATAVAVDRDAFATELVGELIGALDVLWRGVAPEVDGLADGGVDVALEGGLHPDVSCDRDFVGGGEHALDVVGDVGAAADAAVLDDGGEQCVAGEAALAGDTAKLWIDLGELGAVEDVAAIGECVEWFDAAGAAGDD